MSTSKCALNRWNLGSAVTGWVMTIGMIASGQAQTAQLEATVTATNGKAVLFRSASGLSSPVRQGNRLAPGDEIETGGNGRVILTLTDGSQVTVHPNSHIMIKNFLAPASARELIDVLVGYVRIKIYHIGGRRNPYRVNTPVASIAVRGTRFDVKVAITGETRVEVFEGQVEVISQVNPQQKRLLSPGRSVIVRPSGDIGLLAPGPGSELNAGSPDMAQNMVSSYFLNVVSPAKTAPFERFIAFADSYFDSQENPAYAADFSNPYGRFYLLPSFGVSEQFNFTEKSSITSAERPFNYSIVNQTSYFLPIKGTRVVVGGSLTLAYTNAQSGVSINNSFGGAIHNSTDKADLKTFNLSLVAARRFGSSERTGLGIRFEQLEGNGNLESDTSHRSPQNDVRHYQSWEHGRVNRSRLTIGLTRDLAEGKKLGVYYRYGVASTTGSNELNTGLSFFASPANTSTENSEIGVRWRSPLTKRLFYGLHSLMLFDNARSTLGTYRIKVEDFSKRAIFGAGLGYAIRPQTTIAMDIAGGLLRDTESRYTREGLPPLIYRSDKRFVSAHAGGQTDLGRHFFVNGSIFWSGDRAATEYPPPPSRSVESDFSKYYSKKTILNFGPGWRIKKNLYAQYILSKSSESNRKSHTVMLQYNFGSADQ